MIKAKSYRKGSFSTNNGDRTNFPNSYYTLNSLYNKFCIVEDIEGIILKYVVSYCTKKTILLDVGCGTGKYVNLLAPYCRKAIGIDPAEKQLMFADNETSKKGYTNVQYILGARTRD